MSLEEEKKEIDDLMQQRKNIKIAIINLDLSEKEKMVKYKMNELKIEEEQIKEKLEELNDRLKQVKKEEEEIIDIYEGVRNKIDEIDQK